MLAFTIFDHILTLREEIELVWRRKLGLVSALFLLNRYLTLAKMILIFQTTWSDSPTVRFFYVNIPYYSSL